MDQNILEVIVCPLCKGEILFDAASQELLCRFDRLAYPIHYGIPLMFVSRARTLELDEL